MSTKENSFSRHAYFNKGGYRNYLVFQSSAKLLNLYSPNNAKVIAWSLIGISTERLSYLSYLALETIYFCNGK